MQNGRGERGGDSGKETCEEIEKSNSRKIDGRSRLEEVHFHVLMWVGVQRERERW
jgi:hypothetical protein